MKIKENERIDDLQFKGLKVIQNKKEFCFGIDAVLLANFAKNIKKNSYIVDLCTGTGVVAILLSGKSQVAKIDAVEIQKYIAEMASRSISLNSLDNKINIINCDLKELKTVIPSATVDVVTVNPPYKPKNSGLVNESNSKTIARHEILCTLDDIVKEAARLLKFGGSLFMVHRTERVVDVCASMREFGVEPKRIKFIHSDHNSAPNLFLIEGVRGAKPFLIFEKPLFVYDNNGEYTKDLLDFYGG